MDVYKAKIKSHGSLDKLKLILGVRRDFQNKEIIGDTGYPIASIRTLKYFLLYAYNQKGIVHQFDFISAFLQANIKHIVF